MDYRNTYSFNVTYADKDGVISNEDIQIMGNYYTDALINAVKEATITADINYCRVVEIKYNKEKSDE